MTSIKGERRAADQESKRARWRRNKRAERERKRPIPPRELPPTVLSMIESERAHRLAKGMPSDLSFNITNHGWGSYKFHCDVWSVRTRLRAQHPKKRITAGSVARWMRENGLSHGYKPSSLRTMVYRAFEAIKAMEEPSPNPFFGRERGPWWEAFDPYSKLDSES